MKLMFFSARYFQIFFSAKILFFCLATFSMRRGVASSGAEEARPRSTVVH